MTAVARQRTDFNLALNGYRGLCTLLVFVFHLGSAGIVQWPGGTPLQDAIHVLWVSCMYGVEMFFMISGYVILGSLLRHPTVGGFLKDRCIRIFSAWVPTLIAVTAICVAFKMKMFANVSALQGAKIFAANLFLLPPVVPLPGIHYGSWSLTYEWMFYLTAALGAVLIRGAALRGSASVLRRNAAYAVWIALGTLLICLYPRGMFFVTGVVVFHYRDWFMQRRGLLRMPLLSLLVFLVAWSFAQIGDREHRNDVLLDMMHDGRWVGIMVAMLASIHMFASITTNASVQTAFLQTRMFQFLGNISYSFYLWHALVMSFTKRLVTAYIVPHYGATVGVIAFAVLSLAVAVPVSWASWKLFEGSLAQWVRRSWSRPAALRGAARAT
jgi:peptidoglycan/LPS O-acetylase OafA/YrhL